MSCGIIDDRGFLIEGAKFRKWYGIGGLEENDFFPTTNIDIEKILIKKE